MKLGAVSRSLVIIIALGFLAVVGGMVAMAHNSVGTTNVESSLEQKLTADRHLGLEFSAYAMSDFYGKNTVAMAVICPGATKADLEAVQLPEEFIESFNLKDSAVPDDTNYLVLGQMEDGATSIDDMEWSYDQMDAEHIDLCATVPERMTVAPLQQPGEVLSFRHDQEEEFSYLG